MGSRPKRSSGRHIQVRFAHVPRVAEAYGFCRLSRPAWRARANTLRLTRRLSAASHRLAASAVASTKRRWSWGWSNAEGRCALGFIGNYLEDDPSGYVALASIDHF